MMKTARALALAAVLGLANGQAPTAAAPGNQCEAEGEACRGNAGCWAIFESGYSVGNGEVAPPCAGNAQCTAWWACFSQRMLFDNARSPFRNMCPWVGGIQGLWGNAGTLRTEAQCTSAACKWCAADAGCDKQHEDNGAAVASCTYSPDFVFLNLNSPSTAGAIFVAEACGLKNDETRCTQVEDPPRTASPAACFEAAPFHALDAAASVAADAAACDAVTDLATSTACDAVKMAADASQNACYYSREVPEHAGSPAPCTWMSGQCAATAAAIAAATTEFEDAINDANEASSTTEDKLSNAVAAAALPGAVAALFMCLVY